MYQSIISVVKFKTSLMADYIVSFVLSAFSFLSISSY